MEEEEEEEHVQRERKREGRRGRRKEGSVKKFGNPNDGYSPLKSERATFHIHYNYRIIPMLAQIRGAKRNPKLG